MTPTQRKMIAPFSVCCAAASVLLAACASDEPGTFTAPDAAGVVPPPEDAGSREAEAGPCTDECAYFPPTCGPDVFCPHGPFDSTDPSVGLDWRTRVNVITGRSTSDIWMAGAVGAVAHFDGTSWSTSDLGTQQSLTALWLRDSEEVSLGLSQNIHTRGIDGGATQSPDAWTLRSPKLPLPPGFNPNATHRFVAAGWAWPGSEVLWLLAGDRLWRLRVTPESELELLPGAPPASCPVAPCRPMWSIHGASVDTLWAVGDVGAAVRVTEANSASPSVTQFNTRTWVGLTGVWAASDTDVWAVGGAGTIRHYTGDSLYWDVVPDVPTREDLNAVWGTSPSDVWAVGDAGVVLHYDGTRWSRVKVAGLGARRPDLTAVWSPAAGHVWIGGVGVVLALGGKP